jgi:hypothetical protein
MARVDAFPTEIPLLVMLRFATPPDELGKRIPIRIEVGDPDLNVTQTQEADVVPRAHEGAITGWEVKNWLPVQVRLDADRAGVYVVRVRVDDSFAWELPFYVELGS